MSGHSKWSTIKHKKAALDAKRGKVFTRVIKELTVAAKVGGGDPDGNPRLRSAIAEAKASNMPADNIKRAIMKGTGELPGVTYEEVVYEGYGPGGVAVYLEVLTDNKMRTLPEIRNVFTKLGGNLGDTGSVAWMFQKKGLVQVKKEGATEDAVLEVALDAGAHDMVEEAETYDVFTPPDAFESVKQSLEAKGFTIAESQLGMFPQNYIKLDGKKADQMIRLMDALEEHEDVQNVWANFDIPEEELAKLEA
jgi:YebC/PmpR family DNA-binding regulatory protein